MNISTGQTTTSKPKVPAELPKDWREVEIDDFNGRAYVHADGQIVNVVAVEAEGMSGLAVATSYRERWPTPLEIERVVSVFMQGCADVRQVEVGQEALAQSPYSVALMCKYAAQVLDSRKFFEMFG